MKRTFIAVALLAAFASPISFASPGADALTACDAAMKEAASSQFSGLQYDFKTMKGNSTKKLKYAVKLDGQKFRAECKARNGKVLDIKWPEEFQAVASTNTQSASGNK